MMPSLPPLASFCERLTVIDKRGQRVPLRLWSEQRDLAGRFEAGRSVITLKARQIGSSTVHAAWLLLRALFEPDTTGAVLSHKWTSSKSLLDRVRALYLSLPEEVRAIRPLIVDRQDEIALGHGGRIIASSGGGLGGIRSLTCSTLWISELAFAPDPDELLSAGLAAVNEGQVLIESTANYPGDILQRLWTADHDWDRAFFPWFVHEAYRIDPPGDFAPSEEEAALAARFGLDAAQLAWRRHHLARYPNPGRFAREYPSTPEEAWATAAGLLFPPDVLTHIEVLPHLADRDRPVETRFSPPDPAGRYVVGIDPASGTGGHRTAIRVMDADRRAVAWAFDSAHTPPAEVAGIVHREAARYNNALVWCEADTYGHVILDRLENWLGYRNIARSESGGPLRPTATGQARLLGDLRADVPALTAVDRQAFLELQRIQDDGSGRYVLPEGPDGHCDAAVALALANAAARRDPIRIAAPRRSARDRRRLLRALRISA